MLLAIVARQTTDDSMVDRIAVVVLIVLTTGLIVGWIADLWLTHQANRKGATAPPPPWLQCVRCGYNLIASPERCPECGNVIPPKRPAKLRLVRGFVIARRAGQ